MIIYTIEHENIQDFAEDRKNQLVYAGTSTEEALAAAQGAGIGGITLSLWENGSALSSYSFERWATGCGKWERQAGPPVGWIEALDAFRMPSKITPEMQKEFNCILAEMEPENLFCDGEMSREQAMARMGELLGKWETLEKELGRKVTQAEALEFCAETR